jgi:hypothetical protein
MNVELSETPACIHKTRQLESRRLEQTVKLSESEDRAGGTLGAEGGKVLWWYICSRSGELVDEMITDQLRKI